MAIIESKIISNRLQNDGRRHIHEQHIDNVGIKHGIRWVASAGDDISITMSNHANTLSSYLENKEIVRNVEEISNDEL